LGKQSIVRKGKKINLRISWLNKLKIRAKTLVTKLNQLQKSFHKEPIPKLLEAQCCRHSKENEIETADVSDSRG
jgi:hypothetical protein